MLKFSKQLIDLSARLWGITAEFVGFIPQSLVLNKVCYVRLNFNISKLVYYEL